PFGAPLADVFAALSAMDVIDHSAAVDQEFEQLPQCRLVVETADRFWRGLVGDGLRHAKYDRGPNAANFGPQILLSCLFHLTKGERAREKTRQNVYDLSSRRRDHLIHPVGDDIASTRKDYLGVRTS